MRKHPTMVSRAKDYLEHRRALGFALKRSGELLMQFAGFADQSGHRGPLTTDLALRWASLPEKASPRYRAGRLSIVRSFARYLAAQDGRSEVPDRRLMGMNYYRLQPHIYSDRQLRELVLAAAKLKPTYRLRPLTYSTLFGLLASTGLRVSEALDLNKDHVDFARKVMRIEQTKFRKSRLVPIHTTVARAMRRYARERERDPLARKSRAFFVGRRVQRNCEENRGVLFICPTILVFGESGDAQIRRGCAKSVIQPGSVKMDRLASPADCTSST